MLVTHWLEPFFALIARVENHIADGVDELRTPVLGEQLKRPEQSERRLRAVHIGGSAESDCLDISPLLEKILCQKAAVAVTHEHLREMVAIIEPIIEEHKVFDCFLLDITGMPAAIFIGLGVSVGAVIVGKDYIAVLIEHLRGLMISAGIFTHSVEDLNNPLEILHIIPEITMYQGRIEASDIKLLHKIISFMFLTELYQPKMSVSIKRNAKRIYPLSKEGEYIHIY